MALNYPLPAFQALNAPPTDHKILSGWSAAVTGLSSNGKHPMKWYAARIAVWCAVGRDDSGPWTVDEQIRVISARDHEEAYDKAMALGDEEECEYLNEDGETVRWRFAGVCELDEMSAESIEDGTEITSWLQTTSDISALIKEPEDLIAFWSERNKHKTAREILEDREGFE